MLTLLDVAKDPRLFVETASKNGTETRVWSGASLSSRSSKEHGIFSLIFDKKPDGIWNININSEVNDYSFPTKDIFIPIACHLARGGLPSVVAKEIQEIKTKQLFRPIIDNNSPRI